LLEWLGPNGEQTNDKLCVCAGSDVIEKEIRKKSEIGVKILEILQRGEALSTDFMVQLLRSAFLFWDIKI